MCRKTTVEVTISPKERCAGVFPQPDISSYECRVQDLQYKNRPQGGGEATSEGQKQDANVSALTVSISKLQQENEQLTKERDELLAKLAVKVATKAPPVISTAPEATRAPTVCPTGWLVFGTSCYLISKQGKTWSGSRSYCQRQGGHLAIILSAEEQTFLWNLLPRGHWNPYWFGITDGDSEDDWKWVDGTPLVGGFWEVGEPNNHINEDCGYIVKTRVLERVPIRSWFDAPCEMSLPFICEKEMVNDTRTAAPH
ncbi:perlucin-like protein isoform X2 [Cololabis saira]|uniref:perlucin-like protein isoform X2 n=1 Tax=Cololabis saira TaxID=129043 RepID=UPI002AD332A9|nr:perlucin-like protein isoform X2 [Cololabis saira]